MFNPSIGTQTRVDGKSYISTNQGQLGHVTWGDYVRLQPGRYCVIFDISIAGEISDPLAGNYGFVDIVTDAGRKLITKKPIVAESLLKNSNFVPADFELLETTV